MELLLVLQAKIGVIGGHWHFAMDDSPIFRYLVV